jgi:hypothetical protein
MFENPSGSRPLLRARHSAADVSASRDYLLNASGYRPDLFSTSAPAQAAA